MSRILRLALLAPDLVEAILAAETDRGMMLERLERPLPASWAKQRGKLWWSCSQSALRSGWNLGDRPFLQESVEQRTRERTI